MPSRARVQDFIAAVESGDHVKAIEDFYHEDASMQENCLPPRVGRDALINGERAFLKTLQEMRTHAVETYLVDGDRVAINWVFEMTDLQGATRRQDEVALQLWRGDRIAAERFFYDPAQRTA